MRSIAMRICALDIIVGDVSVHSPTQRKHFIVGLGSALVRLLAMASATH